jgi:Fic family protein
MRILKRKKGNKEFYYIQHSFRQNGKVITKEKYIGKTLPDSEAIKKIKISLMKEKNFGLYKKLELIKTSFQKEWNKLPISAKEKAMEQIAVSFTFNTNALEGSKITLEETREIIEDKISPNRLLRDVKETEKHANVFFEMLNKKETVSKELLLDWHFKIFNESKSDIAGKFRNHLVRVGEYLAPDWQDVEYLMADLLKYIKQNKLSKNIVEFAAIIHYRFEKIHPFSDGNGRIGRLLINYLLWQDGYPMIIIDYKKRKSYYRAFLKDESNFVRYFLRRYLVIHSKRYKD